MPAQCSPSSIGIYESEAIPDWQNSLLVSSLKRGRVYRLQLSEDGTNVVGDTTQHFYTQNRYWDIVAAPDRRTFYVITDNFRRRRVEPKKSIAESWRYSQVHLPDCRLR